MAAGIPAPTLPGQAAFAPAKPGVFVALVHKTRLPSCRRQGPVPPRGQHLSSVSAHKRYNTLHFASKVVCQQGCYTPLLDDPAQSSDSANNMNVQPIHVDSRSTIRGIVQ